MAGREPAGMTSSPLAAALSKAQVAHEFLRGKIVNAELFPGHRIVLANIANELDMSVVPVREAVRQLEAEGLVTFERNVGARVAMQDETRYRASMEALGVLEGAATALAVPHLGAKELARAHRINERLATTLDDFDPGTFTQINHEFHRALFVACPNVRLLELVDSEWERLGHLRHSTFSFVPDRARESVQEHEDLLRLIADGVPGAEIEAFARTHRANTLSSYLASQQHQPPAG